MSSSAKGVEALYCYGRAWLFFLGLLLAAGMGRGICQSAPASTGGDEAVVVGGAFSAYHLNYGSRTLLGASIYVDANLNLHYGIEAKADELVFRQRANVNAETYLIGPRYVFGTKSRLRPYARGMIGIGHFNFPYNYAQGNYLVAAAGGGIEYRLSRKFRLRVVDVEYQYWPQFTYNALSSVGISSGIGYDFHW